MNAAAVAIKKLKTVIAKLKRQIAVGIRNARKYILKLIDAENKLESVNVAQPSFSEAQIKEAFIKANGCIKRYWEPEMIELIPQLIGLKIRGCDPWGWMSQFTPIQKMDELGWSDSQMVYCIDASKILVGQNPY